MRTDGLSDEDAVEVAAQVLDALAHAHRTGIVHRDVKPSNILLEQRDEIAVRLLDFGLAQFDGADTLTAVGDVPGTLAYIAPERLAGNEATPESDVWAVGVLLWEALAGRHPFWGVPLQEVARAIEAGAPPLVAERRDLPRRLVAAVDGALAPNPERRPRASALASDLRAAIRQDPPRHGEDPNAGGRQLRATGPRVLVRRRFAPVGLAALGAALGATLLPFWPPALVVAITLVAALAAWRDAARRPRGRSGRSALSARQRRRGRRGPVRPARARLARRSSWRDARWGLLFLAGPLLAPLGLLALVPLVVQPARGTVRRAAQAALAVLWRLPSSPELPETIFR